MPAAAQSSAKNCLPWWSGAGFCAVRADALTPMELRPSLLRMAQRGVSAVWLQTAAQGERPGDLPGMVAMAHALDLKVIVELTLLTSSPSRPEALHKALQQAMQLKVNAVSLPASVPADTALTPALTNLAYTPPGFALWSAAGESRLGDLGPGKIKVRWLNTVNVEAETPADLHAPLLHSQIRQALRSAGPTAIVWNTTLPGGQCLSLHKAFDDSTPPQARYMAQALFSCLKGAFRMDLQTPGAGCPASERLAHFLRWQSQIAAFQHGNLKLLPSHKQLLAFTRTLDESSVLCVFNLSDRYVRHGLPTAYRHAGILAGSGFQGGRIAGDHLDLDPWGALFARF